MDRLRSLRAVVVGIAAIVASSWLFWPDPPPQPIQQSDLLESLKKQEQGNRNLGRAIEHLARAVELLGDGTRKTRDETRDTKAEVIQLKRIIQEIQKEKQRGDVR